MIRIAKTEEDFRKAVFPLTSNNVLITDNGIAEIALIPSIKVHSESGKELMRLFFTALGEAIQKARIVNSNIVEVKVNNPELEKTLEREGFRDSGFKTFIKEL